MLISSMFAIVARKLNYSALVWHVFFADHFFLKNGCAKKTIVLFVCLHTGSNLFINPQHANVQITRPCKGPVFLVGLLARFAITSFFSCDPGAKRRNNIFYKFTKTIAIFNFQAFPKRFLCSLSLSPFFPIFPSLSFSVSLSFSFPILLFLFPFPCSYHTLL